MAAKHSSTNRPLTLLAGVVGLTMLALAFSGCKRPPQMGTDEEVFVTVDALFTAVTARDPARLGRCDQRLRLLKEAGKLPLEASAFLEGITNNARAGSWQPAAEALYDFMRAQRREGGLEHQSAKKDKGRRQAGAK